MRFINTTKLKEQYETDETVNRLRRSVSTVGTRLPSSAAQYAISKGPIVQWLPRYMPKWIIQDFIAGLTIGVMLIPQALAYAKIATIPGEFGLYSSWLPAAVYVIMGTSKDLSTGPTSIMGLLTAEVVAELSVEGYAPEAISSAVAMMVGIYSLLLGAFKLGFVLDYVSEPVLSGFVSAAALTILLGQVGSLVGLTNVGTGTATIIRDVLSQIPQMQPLTVVIGFSGIAFLFALEWVGKKFGKKHSAIKFLSSSRAVLALIIFTTISFVVNRNLKTPLWALSKVTANGLVQPKTPDSGLLQKVAMKSIAPVVAAALEHLAIGKAFGRKNNYAIDQSQELFYLGIANFFNSFFGAMPVGGAMSRTAVNSECGVRSPLSGVFTSGFILLTIYKLAGVLFWIPKATLSAVIIMAVIHIIGPLSVFYRFWRTSLADFTASMLAFWITLFVSTELGIAIAVGFSIGYTMIRLAFVEPSLVSEDSFKKSSGDESSGAFNNVVPKDIVILNLKDAVFFPNAERVKTEALESIQTRHLSVVANDKGEDRSWSVATEKRLERLRRINNINPSQRPLQVVVLNFTQVPFADFTGVTALHEFRHELEKYLGYSIQLRVAGLAPQVRRRLERAEWALLDCNMSIADPVKTVVVYDTLQMAVWDPKDTFEAEYFDEKV